MMKRIAVMFLVILGMSGVSKAQCIPTPNYGYTVTTNRLLPSQVNGVTATINMGMTILNTPGHVSTVLFGSKVTGSGPSMTFTWVSTNGASANSWYTIDGGLTKYPWTANTLNGNSTSAYTTSSIGHTYYYTYQVTAANGTTSADHLTISVVRGKTVANAIASDGYATNYYADVQLVYQGNSTMPQNCVSGTPQHTAHAAAQMTNNRTGDTVGGVLIAGTPGAYNANISATNEVWLSGIPGDEFDGDVEGNVDCSVVGNFTSFNIPVDFEIATTKSANIGASGLVYPFNIAIISYCTPSTTPPDFDPIYAGDEVPGGRPYYIGSAVCVSSKIFSPGWHCPIGFYSDALPSTDNAYLTCTKNPAPY